MKTAPVSSSSSWPCSGLIPLSLYRPCTGEPRASHSTPGVVSSVLSRGGGSFPLTCWQHSPSCSQGGLLYHQTCCWLVFWLMPTRTPRSFSDKLLGQTSWKATTHTWGYSSSGTETAFPTVELHEVPFSPMLQPVQVPLNCSIPIRCMSHSSLCVICDLAEGALCAIIQVINADVEQDWPQYQPLSTSL